MTATGKHGFATLDAMRGVAAIVVLLYHFRFMFDGIVSDRFVFASGYLAVDLFFALSGFVIAHAYDRRLAAGMSFLAFLILRLIRLLPMIWVGIALATVLLWWRAEVDGAHLLVAALANAFILPTPLPWNAYMFPSNGAEWSLFFELAANLIFVALFRHLNGRSLAALIAGSAAGLTLCAAEYGRLHDGYTYATIQLGALRAGFSFFAGVALARGRETWLPRVPRLPPWLILAAASAGLYVPAPHAFRPFYDVAFIMIGSPILIMLAVAVEPSPAGRRLAAWLALGSYPIYAFHQPVRDIAATAAGRLGIAPAAVAVASILLIPPAGLLLARYYDEPLRTWLLARLRRRRMID